MIKVQRLSKSFNKKKVLDNVTFEVKKGETLAIIGSSGCGKSTLLRLLIRLIDFDGGSIFMNNNNIAVLDEEGLIELRQNIGMVFQSSALFDSLSVFENVAFSLREHSKLTELQISQRVKEKLKLVGLENTEKVMPSELSGGMQKRVSIARAMATNPQILLYDEPTTGLDPIISSSIEELVNKLHRELQVTSIIVTHQLSTVYKTADRIIMLYEGKIIEGGSPKEIAVSSHPIIRYFISGGVAK
jgi:phospholipid/cholesterol/gamma-HCH transport system ATP-binding protein